MAEVENLCNRIAILKDGLIAVLQDYQKKKSVIQDIQIDRDSLEQHFVKMAKEDNQ